MTSQFSNIPYPSYFYGNSQEIHTQILDALNSLADQANNSNDNAPDFAQKGYVIGKISNLHNGDNSVANGNPFTGENDFTGSVKLKGCNLYCDNTSTVYLSNELHINTGGVITTPNTTITTDELDCLNNISSNIQTQLNSKQSIISGTTALVVGNLTATSILDNGILNCNGGLVVPTGQTITIPTASLPESAITNLVSDLSNKQNLITSSTNIQMNNLICNQITTSGGEIDYSSLSVSGTLTASGGLLLNSNITSNLKTITPSQIGYLSNITSDIQSQISNKQPLISGTSTISCGNFTASSIIDNGTLTCNNGLTVSSGLVSLPINSLSISETNGLQAALDSKQNAISSSSNITCGNLISSSIVDNGTLTCNNGLIVNGSVSLPINSLSISKTNGLQTALDSKQNVISSSSNITCGNLISSSIIDNGTLTCNNGLTVSSGLVSLPINSLSISETNGLQTALDSKQNAISSSSNITCGNLISSSIVDNGTLTCNNGLIVNGLVSLPINSLSISEVNNLQSALDSKQNTLTTGSISDSLLASTFVKPSSLPILDGTNFINIPESAIINLSTDLSNKQNVLTSGSIGDSLLASTFVKPSSAPILTGTYFSGIPESAIINLSTDLSNKQNVLSNATFLDATSSIQTQLNGKQSTLSNASYLDATSSIQTQLNGKQSTLSNATFLDATSSIQTQLNGKQSTLSNASFLDATSSIQTQLSNKQNTLTAGSIGDTLLTSTFVKPTTAPTLTGTYFSGIPTTAILSGALTVTSLNCTSETDSGNATFGSIAEKITSQGNNGTANSYTLDYTANTAVYALTTAPTANFTIRLNDCGTDTTKTINFAVMYTSKFYCSTVTAYSDTATQITLASSTPIFAGGAPSSIASGTVIIQTFSLIRSFASNYVLSTSSAFY